MGDTFTADAAIVMRILNWVSRHLLRRNLSLLSVPPSIPLCVCERSLINFISLFSMSGCH